MRNRRWKTWILFLLGYKVLLFLVNSHYMPQTGWYDVFAIWGFTYALKNNVKMNTSYSFAACLTSLRLYSAIIKSHPLQRTHWVHVKNSYLHTHSLDLLERPDAISSVCPWAEHPPRGTAQIHKDILLVVHKATMFHEPCASLAWDGTTTIESYRRHCRATRMGMFVAVPTGQHFLLPFRSWRRLALSCLRGDVENVPLSGNLGGHSCQRSMYPTNRGWWHTCHHDYSCFVPELVLLWEGADLPPMLHKNAW